MTEAEGIVSLIKNGEKNNAKIFLRETVEKTFCEEHKTSLEKIVLIKAAEKLNSDIDGFYCDIEKLSLSLFSDNSPKGEEVINLLCDILRNSSREDNKRAFFKARSYIDRNLCDIQLSVGVAADYAGISQSLLIKLFKENENMTAGEYVGKKRVYSSMELLEKGFSVNKAASLVGFSSCETYIRTFKKYMGFTPGEWKRNNSTV